MRNSPGQRKALVIVALAACSDPAVVQQAFEVEIINPTAPNPVIRGSGPDALYECRFDLVARTKGGVRADRAQLIAPDADLHLESGSVQNYPMLSAWDTSWVTAGREARGNFYVIARERYQVTVIAKWMWWQNNQWMDDQTVKTANPVQIPCW